MNKKRMRRYYITAGCIILIILAAFLCIKIYKDKTVSVLFYNIPDGTQKVLTEQIKTIKPTGITFSAYPLNKVLTNRISKQYDMVFCWKNAQTDLLAQKAITPDSRIYSYMATSIGKAGMDNGQQKTIPLLMDHYELAYYRTFRVDATLQIPETLNAFENYLRALKKHVSFPLVCTGSDDRTLLALVSALAQANSSLSGYTALIQGIRQTPSLEKVIDIPLSKTISLRTVLNTLRAWQQDQLIMPKWYELKEQDIDMYMANHMIAVVFMPLSTHRTKPFDLIKYYEATRFPPGDIAANQTLVAPVLEGMMFRNKAGEEDILEHLLSAEDQAQLSTQTMLAPVSSRAEANDLQSDDVRFWAASCSDGPVQGVYDDAFTNKSAAAAFAKQIREYLQK